MTENTTLRVTRPPAAVEVVWEIKNFFELPTEDDYMLESTAFAFSGAEWILRISPNKNVPPPSEQVGWTSLFVKMKPFSSDIRAAFTLSIKRTDSSVFKSMNGTCVFKKESSSWGWNTFCKRSTLLEFRDVIAPQGTLTVSCKVCIKGGNAGSEASDECSILTSELDGFKRKIQALEEKLSTAEKELDASQKEMKDLQSGCPIQTWKFDDWKITIQTLEEKLSTAEKKLDACERKMEDLQNGSNILTSNRDGSRRTIQALEEKLSTAEKELDASQLEMEGLQNDEETLSQHFKQLYLSACQADITIFVKGKQFRAHKSVLAARSSVFRAMFDADMAEKCSESVNIDDCEPETLECFLLFLYSGKLDASSSTSTKELYSVANKYDVKKLKEICRQRMFVEVSVESVCDIVILAALHDEHELLEIATEFFINNANAIVKTSKWLSFLEENLIIANELLVKMTERITE